MTTTAKERELVMHRLMDIGMTWDDAAAVRRIAMTLHRWHELECGDGNNYGSWAIERDEEEYFYCTACRKRFYTESSLCPDCGKNAVAKKQPSGKPYMVHHHYLHGQGKDYTTRTLIADKETGAIKRLAKIMERYPNLFHYVQTDPRGASLYILTLEQAGDAPLDSIYNRGVAVY